nr:C-type lectin 37Da-like [Drosophila bipectinata]
MSTKYFRLAVVVGVIISLSKVDDIMSDGTTGGPESSENPNPPTTPKPTQTTIATKPPNKDIEKIGKMSVYIERKIKRNWFDAYQTCRVKGAYLIHFNTHKEWRDLDLYLWDHDIDDFYWTSGTDLAFLKKKHYWISTGKPITMNIWFSGEPNNNQNGEEHCDEIGYRRTVSGSHRLNDDVCNNAKFFICRYDDGVVATRTRARTGLGKSYPKGNYNTTSSLRKDSKVFKTPKK